MRAVLSVAVAVLCLAGQAVGRDPSDGVPGQLRAEIRVDEAFVFVEPDVGLEVGDVGTIYFDARFVDDSPWSPETAPWSTELVIEFERSGRFGLFLVGPEPTESILMGWDEAGIGPELVYPGFAAMYVDTVAGTWSLSGEADWSYAGTILSFEFTPEHPPEPPATFRRSDCNADGIVDISDPLRFLLHLFGGREISCADACDANDDGELDLSDAVVTLSRLFRGAPEPSAPFRECGADPTEDELACEAYGCSQGDIDADDDNEGN